MEISTRKPAGRKETLGREKKEEKDTQKFLEGGLNFLEVVLLWKFPQQDNLQEGRGRWEGEKRGERTRQSGQP